MEKNCEYPGIAYWLWLTTREELGLTRQHQLLREFGTPEALFHASPGEIERLPLSGRACQELLDHNMDRVEEILRDCDRLRLRLLTLDDPWYPDRLRHIYQPPLVLYLQGAEIDFDSWAAIAVAGTRACTEYGRKMAGRMAFDIARQGGLVVTGVVPGCDYAAATGALRAGGPVVCVLAGGVDVSFDGNSPELYRAVRANGALVSEYPPGTPPLGKHFPVRNRILTGLSVGVLCVEGSYRSGTMKVAELALEQGRDVYVVPSSADSAQGAGMISLLKCGATPVTRGSEVLEPYRTQFITHIRRERPQERERLVPRRERPPRREDAKTPEENHSPKERKTVDKGENKVYIDLDAHKDEYTSDERAILKALQAGEMTADDLVEETGVEARRVLATLTLMTIRQLVEETQGGRYRCLVEVKAR